MFWAQFSLLDITLAQLVPYTVSKKKLKHNARIRRSTEDYECVIRNTAYRKVLITWLINCIVLTF